MSLVLALQGSDAAAASKEMKSQEIHKRDYIKRD